MSYFTEKFDPADALTTEDIVFLQNLASDAGYISTNVALDSEITGGTGGGGFSTLTATGTINGINQDFVFSEEPDYIISDGVWYLPLDGNGVVQWSWNAGTLTATMAIPPISSITGVLNSSPTSAITELTATGTIDDSNTTFTFIQKPAYIVINGILRKENSGWSWSNPTATLTAPVGTGGSIFGIA